jgi:hypothetical protein
VSAKRTLAIRQRWRAKRRRVETRPVATSAYLNDSECAWNTCEYSLPRSLGLALSFLVQVKGTLRAAARLGFRPTDCTAIHEPTIFIYIYMGWNMFKNGDAISVRYTFVIFFSYYLGVFFSGEGL